MWSLVVKGVKRKKWCRMSGAGVSREAPLGVQLLQRLTAKACPRLRLNRRRCYQASVLVLTYFTYMTFHLTRKPISVVKSVLHQNCSAPPPPPPPTATAGEGVAPPDDYWCDWPPFNTSDANTLLGALDSAFLFSYAAAMFISGMIAERVDLRYFLTLGMLFSAIFCYLFGLAKTYSIHHISYYIFVQIGAGIAQTSGWPGTVAIIGNWFGDAKKGLMFGIWNSHTSLGNILGTLIAAEYVDSDWSLSFIYPAVVMGAVAVLVWLLLVPEPRLVGIAGGTGGGGGSGATPGGGGGGGDSGDEAKVVVGDQANLITNRHSSNSALIESEPTEATSLLGAPCAPPGDAPCAPATAVSFTRALAIPGVVPYCLSLFFAKLVSYTFLYWLPLYINSSTSLSARESGRLSTVFDAGGVVGGIAAGVLADRGGAPALVCLAFYLAAAPALIVYQWYGASSYQVNCALLVVTGALVNGPYALITTAVSTELGTHRSIPGSERALATVTACIDGAGSVGAALGPLAAGAVSATSWPAVFYMLVAALAAAALALTRLGVSEIRRLRHERAGAPSPPPPPPPPGRVRIE